jgi:hypothetical protein
MRKWISIVINNDNITANEISIDALPQLSNNNEDITHCKDGHDIICKKDESDEKFAEVGTVKHDDVDILCPECLEKLKEKHILQIL